MLTNISTHDGIVFFIKSYCIINGHSKSSNVKYFYSVFGSHSSDAREKNILYVVHVVHVLRVNKISLHVIYVRLHGHAITCKVILQVNVSKVPSLTHEMSRVV